jgi:hypothetical protein
VLAACSPALDDCCGAPIDRSPRPIERGAGLISCCARPVACSGAPAQCCVGLAGCDGEPALFYGALAVGSTGLAVRFRKPIECAARTVG